MRKKTFLSQLLIFQLILLAVTLSLSSVLFIQSANSLHYQERRLDLLTTTTILSNYFEAKSFPREIVESGLGSILAKGTDSRITLMLPNGVVVSDSESDPRIMPNHSKRPEMVTALDGGEGYSLRFSATVSMNMMYVALPVKKNGQIIGVVRVSVPGDTIQEQIASIYWKVALVSLIALIVAVFISWITARRLSLIVKGLQNVAAHYAREEFDRKLQIDNPIELRQMGIALNKMGKQLKHRLDSVKDQKQELQTILNSMNEPVIFTDRKIHIIKLNAAAEKLFGQIGEDSRGKNLLEIFRNSEFHSFAESLLVSGKDATQEFMLDESGDLVFEVHGTPLEESEPGTGGLLLVLHDISQRKKLELMRKEFVSSVSHELKTPVTNIKGYVETLLFSDNIDSEQTKIFHEIISRHTNRLSAIIDDLLTLSEIEKTDQDEIVKESIPAQDLLSSVLLISKPGAQLKGISIDTEYPDELMFAVHPLLAEQAILNLVENAVKYSGTGTEIKIRAFWDEEKDCPVVEVSDQGPGISPVDLDRIFERFYRVDKARSRKVGGTGLGLSIVKHIALVHGGNVHAESIEGKGSLFTIEF